MENDTNFSCIQKHLFLYVDFNSYKLINFEINLWKDSELNHSQLLEKDIICRVIRSITSLSFEVYFINTQNPNIGLIQYSILGNQP